MAGSQAQGEAGTQPQASASTEHAPESDLTFLPCFIPGPGVAPNPPGLAGKIAIYLCNKSHSSKAVRNRKMDLWCDRVMGSAEWKQSLVVSTQG